MISAQVRRRREARRGKGREGTAWPVRDIETTFITLTCLISDLNNIIQSLQFYQQSDSTVTAMGQSASTPTTIASTPVTIDNEKSALAKQYASRHQIEKLTTNLSKARLSSSAATEGLAQNKLNAWESEFEAVRARSICIFRFRDWMVALIFEDADPLSSHLLSDLTTFHRPPRSSFLNSSSPLNHPPPLSSPEEPRSRINISLIWH